MKFWMKLQEWMHQIKMFNKKYHNLLLPHLTIKVPRKFRLLINNHIKTKNNWGAKKIQKVYLFTKIFIWWHYWWCNRIKNIKKTQHWLQTICRFELFLVQYRTKNYGTSFGRRQLSRRNATWITSILPQQFLDIGRTTTKHQCYRQQWIFTNKRMSKTT